ncbi:Alpha/beta hydrolase [Sphingomonas sp. EC-HK361]|uniref:alpha/beta hydrolase n=1 Tax=Sphingomonas sp. EC-HK361 TaxID=2038397 RepID=UPI00125173A4|nr:alpha/beta hydrolase [Sphingomonas sp. EC-HK361]VVT11374.1 Alpha/beta hydrolase [Sphingomonas sp. EC-HK361]
MRVGLTIAAAVMLVSCSGGAAQPGKPDEKGSLMSLPAADKMPLIARKYSAEHPRATILLFHQAGSGKGEYATIAPRLTALGYDAVAVDARSGGGLYGENETVQRNGRSTDMKLAQRDLQGAVDWAAAQGRPVILWGSSYSAALAFPVAAANPGKVKAVLAFSPGEYFDGRPAIAAAAKAVTVPVFITAAPTAEEQAQAKPIFDAVGAKDKTLFVPKDGVHGSSTLIAAKNPAGAASEWTAVEGFLKKLSL